MKLHTSSIIQDQNGENDDKGFTLIEILIAIVLVGILSAVAVVGISNLVSKGGSSACGATADSSRAASAVYFATTGAYPTTFTALTSATTAPVAPAALTLPTGVAVGLTPFTTLIGSGWTITLTPGSGTAAPTFGGCP
jgi:type IV pilus assembly protein PilA